MSDAAAAADQHHDTRPIDSHSGHHEASEGVNSTERQIVLYLVGGLLVLTTSIVRALGLVDDEVAQFPAMIGALILAFGLFRNAFQELSAGKPAHGSLASLAVLAAFATGRFEIAGYVAFVLLIFDLALHRTAWGARRAIEDLIQLTPDTARIVKDGQEAEGPLTIVKVGDTVRVRPGENFPVDGELTAGSTTINEASLTGEALPVEKATGERVFAGTTNLTAQVDLRVTEVGADTTIGKVATLIHEAETSRTPRQLLIEQVARYFVPVVLTIAGLVWFIVQQTDPERAIELAITVLVVATPSALLIASPSAMVAAFAAAARLGVMIKQTQTLEAAASCDTLIFDKTGTLTTGRFAVSRLEPAEGAGERDQRAKDLLRSAAYAEQQSNHPIATSIVATAMQAKLDWGAAEGSFEEVHGKGVRAGDVIAGRASYLRECGADEVAVDMVEERLGGMTAVHVMGGGRYLGAVGLEDRLRRNAKTVIEQCRDLGARLVMLVTGDRFAVAKRVGQTVGVDQLEAECLPEEKHAIVTDLARRGSRVLMVGDGINDGPSLAAADVGVAMGLSGSDIATNSAGVALMTDDISRIPFLIQLARRTQAVITQNIVLSMLLAIGGLMLAATGQFAAFGETIKIGGIGIAIIWHFMDDLVVLANSFRLFRFGEEFAEHERLVAEAEAEAAAARAERPREASARLAPAAA
ncbi:MAG: cation-translocating P-type ATPase [Planctomycetota bacterium]